MEILTSSLVIWLYGITGAIEIAAYTPQVVKLVRVKERGDEISVGMWGLWFLASIIAMFYGVFHLKDVLFSLFSGAHVLGCGLIILLTIYNRNLRFGKIEQGKNPIPSKMPHPILDGRVELPHETLDVAEAPSYMHKVDDYPLDYSQRH